MKNNYRTAFDKNLDISLTSGIKLLAEFPKSAKTMLHISKHEKKAKKQRDQWASQEVYVPPLAIISTTDRCNLQCKGCYSAGLGRDSINDLPKERVEQLLDEISAAGTSTILLAGGEPLLSTDWINTMAKHDELVGLIFTNGTLFNETWYDFFEAHRHMLPLFSVEGSPDKTDDRRGEGTAKSVETAMAELYQRKIPFGISITTGEHNIKEVATYDFVEQFIAKGCRVVVHVEYVPMDKNQELLALTEESKKNLATYCDNHTGRAIFMAFPGNEDQYDGCLAAGRGFVHISTNGSLEPCPFAPYSDRNISNMSYIDALKSPLLRALRAESNRMHEGVGGCSLRNQEEWIHEILNQEGGVALEA